MESKIHEKIMELLGHPHLEVGAVQECLQGLKTANPTHDVYRDFFYLLTHVELTEQKARQHWSELTTHHGELEKKLGGALDVRVSALNYFITVVGELESPKIMEMKVYLNDQSRILRDELTGLYNYRHFRETLPTEVNRAKGASTSVALLLLDLDDFKRVNDEHGHLIGDRVLQRLGKLIQQQVGSSGLCFRYGGEELALMLPGMDKKRAYLFAEDIRSKLEAQDFVFESRSDGKGAKLNITGSVGVACFPFDAEGPDALVGMADKALYSAKGSGKNKVAMYSENLRRHERYEIQLDGRISVLSQPTIAMKVLDISQSGIGFTSEARFQAHDVVAIDIELGGRGKSFRMVGRIAYVNEKKRPTLYGAEFIGVNEESNLDVQNIIRSVRSD